MMTDDELTVLRWLKKEVSQQNHITKKINGTVSTTNRGRKKKENTDAPVTLAEASPPAVTEPTDAPVAEHIDAPVAEQTDAPKAEQTDAPVAEQTDAPVAEPTASNEPFEKQLP